MFANTAKNKMKFSAHVLMFTALAAVAFILAFPLPAAPKDAKVMASWSVNSSDSFSDTEDVISSVPRYNDSELGIAYFIYRSENPGDTKYLASIRLALYNRKGKKTEAEIPLENPSYITKTDKLELVALYKGAFYFTREYAYSYTQTNDDTTTTTEVRVVNVTRVDLKTKSIGTENTVTLTDSEKVTTTVGETVVSITGRSEDLKKLCVLSKGVFAASTTRLYVDSELEPGFYWARIYDLKLVIEKVSMPNQYLADGGLVEYSADILDPKDMVMEKKKIISDTERTYDVIIYRSP